METEVILLIGLAGFLIWWFIGIGILIWDITTYSDLKVKDLGYVLGLGLSGLIILIIVLEDRIEINWKIKNKVLIKKRKR